MMFNNRNVSISPSAKIGKNVKIGDNATIYDNVEIGDDSIICPNAVLGEPLPGYYEDEGYENPPTVIGAGSMVRSHAIIYASNTIGAHFKCGHHAIVRAGNRIGHHCSVGNASELHGEAVLGDYVRLHSDVCISERARIEDFVWLFPGATLANAPTPPSNEMLGPVVGAYSVVAVNAVLLPGVKVGENCLIGAGAMVSKDVEDFSLMIGNPARRHCDVREFKAGPNRESHYPWPQNFDRGMPWQGIGFEAWQASRRRDAV